MSQQSVQATAYDYISLAFLPNYMQAEWLSWCQYFNEDVYRFTQGELSQFIIKAEEHTNEIVTRKKPLLPFFVTDSKTCKG